METKPIDFASLTKPQQRVQIAQDVLAQMMAKKIKPYSGLWLDLDYGVDKHGSAQEVLNRVKSCEACAIGALLVCTALRDERVVPQFASLRFSFTSLSNVLEDYFSKEQCRLIEIAFEGGTGGVGIDRAEDCTPEERAALKLYDSCENAAATMAAIMANITKNNGEFKPENIEENEISAAISFSVGLD